METSAVFLNSFKSGFVVLNFDSFWCQDYIPVQGGDNIFKFGRVARTQLLSGGSLSHPKVLR